MWNSISVHLDRVYEYEFMLAMINVFVIHLDGWIDSDQKQNIE